MILKFVVIIFILIAGHVAIPGSFQAIAVGVFFGLYTYDVFKKDFLNKR